MKTQTKFSKSFSLCFLDRDFWAPLSVDHTTVSRGFEHRTRPGERFSASANVQEILAGREAEAGAAFQICVEGLQIAREAGCLARSNERVYSCGTIWSTVELEVHATNSRCCYSGSIAWNWSRTSDSSKPNHNFVLVGTWCGWWGKHIVGHICNDAASCVAAEEPWSVLNIKK